MTLGKAFVVVAGDLMSVVSICMVAKQKARANPSVSSVVRRRRGPVSPRLIASITRSLGSKQQHQGMPLLAGRDHPPLRPSKLTLSRLKTVRKKT